MSETTKKRIVLIEDEDTLSYLIQRKLEKAGYEVKVAKDGQTGLDYVRTTQPDLVLLDMMLPVINGFGILEALAQDKLLPTLPVIIISNSGQDVEVERAVNLGIRDYLIKVDLTPDEVIKKVDEFFSRDHKEETDTKEVDRGDKKEIPLEKPAHAASLEPRDSSRPAILIVEDDMILVELLERKFQGAHYQVFKAYHVDEARKILKENHVDLILLDIVLPDTDGFTYLAELKTDPTLRNIPVVIISNLGQREEVERGIKAGAVDYLIKANVLPAEIVKKVGEILKK